MRCEQRAVKTQSSSILLQLVLASARLLVARRQMKLFCEAADHRTQNGTQQDPRDGDEEDTDGIAQHDSGGPLERADHLRSDRCVKAAHIGRYLIIATLREKREGSTSNPNNPASRRRTRVRPVKTIER